MNKKIKISVGISAYNEEKNIQNILSDIFSQKQKNWNLEEVIVYCDGCSDNTYGKVKELKSKKIKVFNGEKRKGKPYRLGQIFKQSKGDFIVIFDGDIALGGKNVIDDLIRPMLSDSKVFLVGGNTRPLLPKTFFEKAVYSTFLVFEKSRYELRGGNNLFGCTGACMVLRKEFAKKINFPEIINEDDFIYFSCIKNRYKFIHVRKAKIYYKLPNKLSDYLRQIFRSNPEAIYINFKKYFGEMVEKEYKRPLGFYAKNIFKVFIKHPLPVAYIIFINIISRPFFPVVSRGYKWSWHTASSTKDLSQTNTISKYLDSSKKHKII